MSWKQATPQMAMRGLRVSSAECCSVDVSSLEALSAIEAEYSQEWGVLL